MNLIRSTDAKIHTLTSKDLGGKGYRLAQLCNQSFNVPPFFVLTSSFVADVFKELNIDFEALNSKERAVEAASEIKRRIENFTFSFNQKESILAEFDAFFGDDGIVSVRSSGGMEDGVNNSFAGQYATFLYISRDELLEKIRDCIASAWSSGVIAYRIQQGIGFSDSDFAVIIQKMIFAEKSGVAFSMNPSGNLADAIVVTGYGVGEGIVADHVETDSYLIRRLDQDLVKMVVDKSTKLSFSPNVGIVKSDVDDHLRQIAVLTDDQILEVFKQLMKAESILGTIADIEFCFDSLGKFFMLQMRPVTGIDLSKIELLDNTNIVESYPGISLELTFSFARNAYENAFKGASKAFWIPQETIHSMQPVFQHLLGYHQGRIYYRLDNWYKMITLVFSSKKSIQSWEKAVGLKRPASDELKLSFGNKLKVIASSFWQLLNYRRGNRKFFKLFNEKYQALRSLDKNSMSLLELSEALDVASNTFFEFWYLTLINDLMTFKSFDWVQKGIERRDLGPKDMANDLIAGKYQSESEISIVEVLKLKEMILNDQKINELFQESAETIWETIETESLNGFSEQIRSHIDRFGDRTLAELKLENASFRQAPIRFIELLKGQLTSNGSISSHESNQQNLRESSEEILKKALKWWNPRSYFFKFSIRMAAYGTRNREDMRFCRTRIFGAAKDFYWEMGKRLVKLGKIENADDIFYLNNEEVRLACQNGHELMLMELISSRKLRIEKDRACDLPSRIIYTDQPPFFKKSTFDRSENAIELEGIAVSKGIIRAEAIVISEPSYNLDVAGKIIITEITDPGWVFLMSQGVGLISEKGSLLSHTAIVGREMGIPVIVSVANLTKLIRSGDLIEMDGQRGTVTIIERGPRK